MWLVVVLSEFLALSGAFLFGLGTVLVRKGLVESSPLSATVIVTSVGAVAFWVLTFILVPLNDINPTGVLFFALAGIFMPGFARFVYYKGIETLGASMTASIFAIYPLFSSLLAIFLLGEQPSIGTWVGVICIICGVTLIESNVRNTSEKPHSTARIGLAFPLSSALLVGFGYLFRKMGLNVHNEPISGIAVAYLSSLTIYTLIIVMSTSMRRSISLDRLSFQLFWKAGLIMGAGHLCGYYALRYGDVSLVASLMNVEPFFVFLFAHILLKEMEKITYKLVIGTLIIVIGISLITIF